MLVLVAVPVPVLGYHPMKRTVLRLPADPRMLDLLLLPVVRLR